MTRAARFIEGSRSRKLVLVSIDGLCAGDEAAIRRLPHFRRIVENGFWIEGLEGIYPSQTYPVHVSAMTGTYPDTHGVYANTLCRPGWKKPDWFWYDRCSRSTGLYTAAQEAGLRVAIFLWPGAVGAPAEIHIPEIKPTRAWRSLPAVFSAGPFRLLCTFARFGNRLLGLSSGSLDDFTTAAAAHALRERRPDLLLIHLLSLDVQRHRCGSNSPQAARALRSADRRLGILMDAAEDAGGSDAAVFVLGDHGHRDIGHRVALNAAFRQAGLAAFPRRWEAWANVCGGSAHIRVRPGLLRRVERLLAGLSHSGEPVIDRIFGAEDIRRLRLGGAADLAVEARGGYAFSAETRGPVIRRAPRTRCAEHGYLPDAPAEYRPVFFGSGGGLPSGIVRPGGRIVDVGPTLGALLGLRLPKAEGRPFFGPAGEETSGVETQRRVLKSPDRVGLTKAVGRVNDGPVGEKGTTK